jgi:hypothetical protein
MPLGEGGLPVNFFESGRNDDTLKAGGLESVIEDNPAVRRDFELFAANGTFYRPLGRSWRSERLFPERKFVSRKVSGQSPFHQEFGPIINKQTCAACELPSPPGIKLRNFGSCDAPRTVLHVLDGERRVISSSIEFVHFSYVSRSEAIR